MSDELKDPSSTEIMKVAALRRLVTQEPPDRVRAVLAEAAALPANAAILKHIVRAYTYARDRAAVPEVAEFLAHPNRAVVCAAIRALVELDPTDAVTRVGAVVQEAPHEVAFPAALALARACPEGSKYFFLELTRSERYRDRMAALIYLRSRPPVESVPVLLDMLRREPDDTVRAQLNKLLARRIAKRDAQVLVDLRAELAAKVAELDQVLALLPEKLDPTWRGAGTPPELAAAGDVIAQARARMEQRVAAAPAAPERAEPAPEPMPEPDAVTEPGYAGPVRVAVAGPMRGSGSQKRPPKEAVPGTSNVPAWLGPSLALGFGFAIGALLMAWPSGAPGPATTSPPAASALGNPGESVEVSGVVIEILRAQKTVVLKRGNGATIEAQFLEGDITGIQVGESLRITGILREVRAGEVYRVRGLTFGRG